jgi:predicted small secreted protein
MMTTPQKWIVFGVVKLALLAVAVGVVFSMYGCNTVRGVGQDIERAGDAIKRSADK